ncbi:hypothetical protein chiPu_0021911 [Chiloscyllium punctatum]|uniref:Uncharacterized protein n=1 Tax=Chiloscyllium punctatum TaxID=137246 RepID=A0A401RF00_CHIPU|nr:hypothetical protein [Chiloscyllium punctatum]
MVHRFGTSLSGAPQATSRPGSARPGETHASAGASPSVGNRAFDPSLLGAGGPAFVREISALMLGSLGMA